jgi:hypothetical protein
MKGTYLLSPYQSHLEFVNLDYYWFTSLIMPGGLWRSSIYDTHLDFAIHLPANSAAVAVLRY